jgi:hypothetical protein
MCDWCAEVTDYTVLETVCRQLSPKIAFGLLCQCHSSLNEWDVVYIGETSEEME